MKQFAFPLSIKCASVEERDECIKLLESIGYESDDIDDMLHVTNIYRKIGICSTIADSSIYLDDSHYIDHFNPSLIRDIARVCTNDTWQKDDVVIAMGHLYCPYEFFYKIIGKSCHENLEYFRRPTLAEICEHHGYKVVGRDIVKKSDKISNCDKSYCATSMRLDEATSEINRLKAENAELKEKLEAVTDVDNQELERLRSENAELKVKNIELKDLALSEMIKNTELHESIRKSKKKLSDFIKDLG